MGNDYELSLSYIKNDGEAVVATVVLSCRGYAFGEILTLNCRIEKVDGESLSYYEKEAINKATGLLKDIASKL